MSVGPPYSLAWLAAATRPQLVTRRRGHTLDKSDKKGYEKETLASQDTCLSLTAKRLPHKLGKDAAYGGCVNLFALTSMCCFLGEDRWRRRAKPVPAITLQSDYNQSTIRIHSEYIQSTFRVCDLQDFVYILLQRI